MKAAKISCLKIQEIASSAKKQLPFVKLFFIERD